MFKYIPIVLLCLLPRGAQADNPLPPIPSGLTTVTEGDCTDNVSRMEGYCKTKVDANNNIYLVFRLGGRDGEIQFIRMVTGPSSYVTIWQIDESV